jgi:hypothetical protein
MAQPSDHVEGNNGAPVSFGTLSARQNGALAGVTGGRATAVVPTVSSQDSGDAVAR